VLRVGHTLEVEVGPARLSVVFRRLLLRDQVGEFPEHFSLGQAELMNADILGLPPGWRFLIAPGYLDVWYDASLLDI
jgi:hypothetical protein